MTFRSKLRRCAAAIACAATVTIAPLSQAQDADPAPCTGTDGKVPVIEAGREREVKALFSPHQVGVALPEPANDWTFDQIRVMDNRIVMVLKGPGGETSEPWLGPASCAPETAERAASFYLTRPSDSPKEATDLLWSAVQRSDTGGFYRTFVDPEPARPKSSPVARELKPAPERPRDDAAPRRVKRKASSWFKTQSALAVVVLLGLLGGLFGLLYHLRELHLRGQGSGRSWALLGGITAMGAIARLATPATFLREAYPLPNVHYLVHGLDWGGEIATYPQAQALLARGLSPVLAANPFDAWFQLNLVLGVVSIPAAWAAGAALTRSRNVATAAALLMACWPQHIRFTASESTHVGFVLGILVTIALAALAARSNRSLPFVALVFATALTVLTRPEGALIVPGLAVLVLGAGAGTRDVLKRPLKLAAVLVAGALIAPTLLHIATSDSASAFDPDAGTGEALSVHTLTTLMTRLLWPSEHNAFFDPATCPPWLYLLAIAGAVIRWRRPQPDGLNRLGLLGLLVIAMTYFTLYAGMEPAITVWGMGRYHLSILPIMVLLSALGLDTLSEALSARAKHAWSGPAAVMVIPMVGMLLWWPAVMALPMDWQTELDWLLRRGRTATTQIQLPARLVLPDNRRRFRDLSPRAPIIALSGGEAREETSVTVAQAIEHLEPTSEEPVYFLEGLYCFLAVDRDEQENPQCEAMKATFDLELIDSVQVTSPSFLVGYTDLRREAPFSLSLWRVTGRRLSPAEGLAQLPRPITPEDPRAEAGGVIASPTSAAMWPSEPPFP